MFFTQLNPSPSCGSVLPLWKYPPSFAPSSVCIRQHAARCSAVAPSRCVWAKQSSHFWAARIEASLYDCIIVIGGLWFSKTMGRNPNVSLFWLRDGLNIIFLRRSLIQRSNLAGWNQAAFIFIKTVSRAPFYPIFNCLRRNKAWNDVCRDAITKASIKWFKAFCSIHREPLITGSVLRRPQKSLKWQWKAKKLSLKVRTEQLSCEVWIWVKCRR